MKKQIILAILASATALMSTACSGFKFAPQAQNALQAVNQGQSPTQASENTPPQCVMDDSDYTLNEELLDFEIVSQTNVGFGFNILSGLLKAFGLNIATKSGQMTMTMNLSESMAPLNSVADVQGQAKSSSDNFSFNLGIWQIGVNAGYFYQTPLSTLTANTIKNALGNLRSRLNTVDTQWYSRIVWADPAAEQYVIPAGSVAGLRLGDQFALYNVNYIWSGVPCQSELRIPARTTTDPLAIAVVTQLADNAALLQITSRNSEESIQLGGQAVVSELPLAPKEKSRTLAKSVKIGTIQNTQIPIDGSAPVDLSIFLNQQTQALLANYGLYPRQ